MKEQLYLSIPEPCHEDWNKMTPVEQGRHCAVCQKNVVDFTNESDEAIVDFFNNYNGSACGRFTDEQLNRPLSKIVLKPASNFLRYAAGLLLPFTFFTSKLHAQKGQVAIKGDTTVAVPNLKTMLVARPVHLYTKDSFKIKQLKPVPIEKILTCTVGGLQVIQLYEYKGIIKDERTGEVIPGASIQIEGTNTGIVSGFDGRFVLTSEVKSLNIKVTTVGYEAQVIRIDNLKNNDLNVYLKPHAMGLGEVVIVGFPSKTKKIRTGTGSVKITSNRNIKDSIMYLFSLKKIAIYPNPVNKNEPLNIDFFNISTGTYQIRLLNASGQLFYSFQKQITSPKETEQIYLNEKMSAGIYLLQIIDDKKRVVQTSKVVVQ